MTLELSLEKLRQMGCGKAGIPDGGNVFKDTIVGEIIYSGHCKSFQMGTGLER